MNCDETMWLAIQLSPLSCYCYYADHLELLCVIVLHVTVILVVMQEKVPSTCSSASMLVFGFLPGGMPLMLFEVIVYF